MCTNEWLLLVPRKLSTPGSIQPEDQFEEELGSYMRLILTNEEIVDFHLLSFCKLRSESY